MEDDDDEPGFEERLAHLGRIIEQNRERDITRSRLDRQQHALLMSLMSGWIEWLEAGKVEFVTESITTVRDFYRKQIGEQ